MSKVFNAKVLSERAPAARKVIEVVCPDYDGEIVFRVREMDGSSVFAVASKQATDGDFAAVVQSIAESVVDEKGAKVFSYETAADFLYENQNSIKELQDAITELSPGSVDEGGEPEDPTSAE